MSRSQQSIELRAQVRLAAPLALGQLGQQLMSIVDAAMLGRYSDAALAGVGIAIGLLFSVTCLGMGLIMGLDSLIPQALGAGQPARARQLLRQGVRLSLWVGVPLTAVCALVPLLLPLAGVTPEVATEARLYIFGRLPAILPFLVFTALRSYLQASSITWPIVLSTVAGNVVNAVADYLLIFGDQALHWLGLPGVGVPELGILGAALSTTCVTLVSMTICGVVVYRLHAAQPDPVPEAPPGTMRSIVVLGLPVGLHLAAEVGIFALTAVLVGRLGTIPAAAHEIALVLASFTFNIVVGVGAATSVRVGLAVGAANLQRARMAGLTGLGMGAGIMSCAALVFLTIPEALAFLFTSDPEIIRAAVPLLRIAALFQLSDCAQAVAAGALRGLGDTRAVLWANLAGHYIVGLGTAMTLTFGLDLGAPGLWLGLSAGLTSVGVILIARFLFSTRSASAPMVHESAEHHP